MEQQPGALGHPASALRAVMRRPASRYGLRLTPEGAAPEAAPVYNGGMTTDPLIHALLVEDDGRLAELTSEYLQRHEVTVTLASDGEEGLELGADDYVPKPFSPRELLARLRTAVRTPATALHPHRARRGLPAAQGRWPVSQSKPRRRLFWRIYFHGLALIVAVAFAAVAVFILLGGGPSWRSFPDRLAQQLKVEFGPRPNDRPGLQRRLAQMQRLLEVDLAVYRRDGTLLGSAVRAPPRPLSAKDADQLRGRRRMLRTSGLALSQRITRAHAGTITARSRPGGGAVFRVILPRSSGKASS